VRKFLDRGAPRETKPPAEINPVLAAIKRML
jgi:hypothetical protein